MRQRILTASLSVGLAFGCVSPEDESEPLGPPEGAIADVEAWGQSYQAKDDPKSDTSGCSGVIVPDQGDFGGRVALTFDDGPRAATTRKVIDTLREFGAPATFFINGRSVSGDDSRDLLKEIVADENFILANHSWGHLNMAHQGEEKVEKEIDRVNDLITEVGGTPTYFRFPFGSSNCGTAEAVRQRNMIITGWHIDSADWCFDVGGGTCPESTFRYVPDSMRDDMVGLVLQQVRARNGGVLLFHDVKSFTASSLPEVLEALRDEGYTFISLDDEEAFPLLHGQEPPPRPFVGDACTADEDCGFRNGQRWDGFCMNGQCAVGCEGYCPDMHGKAATFCVNDPDPEVAGGVCVPKAGPINSDCADSTRQEQDRYRGGSNAPAAQAAVCVPAEG